MIDCKDTLASLDCRRDSFVGRAMVDTPLTTVSGGSTLAPAIKKLLRQADDLPWNGDTSLARKAYGL